ncbi:putative reverse transcriptase domain-containing protein [Tanacetum coccineum]
MDSWYFVGKWLNSGELFEIKVRKSRIGVAAPRALVYGGLVTSEDARSSHMISEDAKSWVCLHIFTVILHNCPTVEILAQRLASRGGGRTRGHSGDQGNGRIDGQGGQVGGQGSEVNDGVDEVPDFSTIIAQQLQNLLPTIVAQVGDQGRGQGNGRNQNGDAVNDNIRGDIEKMEFVQDMSGCGDNQKVKYIVGSFVGKALTWWNSQIRTLGAGHAAYTDRFHELARLVPHLVTPEGKRIERYVYGLASQIGETVPATEPKTIQKAVQIAGTLTNETLRNGSIKKNPGNACHFAKDCRVVPRNVNPINARNPTDRACYECGSTDHIKSACPMLNRAHEPGGNHPNQALDNHRGQGRGNQGNQATGKAFMLGAEEARQDSNIMMGTFTLNDHYATTLFDSGADFNFISATFIHLLGIEPSDLGFSYEIEIASGQLVEIDKVIRDCKLEIEGHVFDINLIPFGSGSFDVIIGMDWLSDHKAEIICYEKVVRIPLLDGKVHKVIGERPDNKVRHLVSAKAKEQLREELVVVRYFPEVFPDDLSRLPPSREIKFRIELVPGEMPVTISPYRLAPSEMEELSGHLKKL